MRVDYNVPISVEGTDEDLHVTIRNDQRIKETLPTIDYLKTHGAKRIVLMSHMGRPNGKVVQKYSLRPAVKVLEQALNQTVGFVPEFTEDSFKATLETLTDDCKILLLENLRFTSAEEVTIKTKEEAFTAPAEDVEKFSRFLSSLGDIYVNDAFGACHRAHTSITKIDVPIKAAGLLLMKEIEVFSTVINNPRKPVLSIIGGSKVSDKIKLIENLLGKVQKMIIAGGMSYTFRKVLDNMSIGDSLFDSHGATIVNDLMDLAKKNNVEVYLPIDYVVSDKFSPDANTKVVNYEDGIESGWSGLDVGPKTSEIFEKVIMDSKTVIWNGPLGVFEMTPFSHGTRHALNSLIKATRNGTVSVIGGGDTATAAMNWNMDAEMTHVSTGGGAALELLEGKLLPGIAILSPLQSKSQSTDL